MFITVPAKPETLLDITTIHSMREEARLFVKGQDSPASSGKARTVLPLQERPDQPASS